MVGWATPRSVGPDPRPPNLQERSQLKMLSEMREGGWPTCLSAEVTIRCGQRGSALFEEAVERSRPSLIAERLRANVGWLAQAALATAAAWVLAQEIFSHERPVFAPVAALIGVSASLGQRRRSAVEMVIGVALGIGIADALVGLIGTGPLQIAAVVCAARWSSRSRLAAAACWSARRPRRRCSW